MKTILSPVVIINLLWINYKLFYWIFKDILSLKIKVLSVKVRAWTTRLLVKFNYNYKKKKIFKLSSFTNRHALIIILIMMLKSIKN